MTLHTLKINELTDPNDILSVLSFLIKRNERNQYQFKRNLINEKLNLSSDKITEILSLFLYFDIIEYRRNKPVYITKFGRNYLSHISLKKNNENKILVRTLLPFYRKIPQIKKLLRFYILKRNGNIGEFNHKDNERVLSIKELRWVYLHLKRLGIINYTRFNDIKLTESGSLFLQVFLIEEAIRFFGRDRYLNKIDLSETRINEIIEFLEINSEIFAYSYAEATSIISLLKNNLLTGDLDLLVHPSVKQFRDYVSNNYEPSRNSNIALLLPCAKGKPFSSSRTHKRVHNALNGILNGNSPIKNIDKIEEFIISEPLGIIPRKFEMIYPAASYDMTLDAWVPLDTINQNQELNDPSKFFSSIQRNKEISHTKNEQKKTVITEISKEIYTFFENYSQYFDYIVAYVRSTHRDMVEIAAKGANVDVIFVPDERDMNELKETYGPVSWSLRGMRNTRTLEILINRLEKLRI